MQARHALKKLSDAQLVILARQQLPYATTAYEELMRRHEKPLLSLCRNLCGNEADAEDAFQEVLLRVFHNLPRFRGDASFRTWVYRIAYNECMTLIRRRKDHDDMDDHPEPEAPAPAEAADDGRPSFHHLIAHLGEEDRSVLALRLISDLDFNDIAAITQSGLSAVKMRYKRALEKLKPLMENLR